MGPKLEKYLVFWAPNQKTTSRADNNAEHESSLTETQSPPASTGQDTRLGSKNRGNTYVKHKIDVAPLYFTWDISQDLLVLFGPTNAE